MASDPPRFPFCDTKYIAKANCSARTGPNSAPKYHFRPLIAYTLSTGSEVSQDRRHTY